MDKVTDRLNGITEAQKIRDITNVMKLFFGI